MRRGGAVRIRGQAVVAAPVAAAGPDQSFDMLGAAPIQLAGSATGVVTSYLWTKVSGSATPVFSDATNPLATCTVDVDGGTPLTLNLAATGPGGTTNDTVVITIAATVTALMARMASGSRVAVGYEIDVSTTTVTGAGVSQLNDLGAGGKNLTQGTDSLRPAKGSGTGPAGKNCVAPQSATRRISNTAIGVAAGKALSFFHVAKAGGATAVQCSARTTASEGASDDSLATALNISTTAFRYDTKATGVAAENVTVVTPAYNTNWQIVEVRYAAATLTKIRVNQVDVVPNCVTTTGLAAAWGGAVVGHLTASGGAWYATFGFEAVSLVAGTACLSERAAIYYYINKQTGL